MTARRWALAALWVVVMGAELLALTVLASYDAPDNLMLDLLVAASAVSAGVVALDQRPGNRIGWLMVAMAVAWVLPPLAGWGPPAFAALTQPVSALFLAFAAHLVLAYPSGLLQTRYERVVIVLIYLALAWPRLAAAVTGTPEDGTCTDCSAYDVVVKIGSVQLVVLATAFAVAVLLRFARSSRIERRELVPLWAGAVLLAVIEVIGLWDDHSWVGFWRVRYDVRSLLLMLLPLVFLYGLLTSRTAVSAVGGLVLRLRDGVPPGQLEPVLAAAVGDPSLRVFYATDSSGGWTSAGHDQVRDLASLEDRNHAVTVIERDGHPYAAMVHDRAVSDALVRGVASAAAISMENERLHAELRAQLEEVRASRARIVAAGDRERRRVERDLHDGAQQRLLALSMALRTARSRLDGGSTPESLAALDAADSELRQAIRELRELARGIHPTILTDDGLEAAVRSLAARAPLPVRVDFAVASRPSRQTEATAYFAVSECLANVAKHSGATTASVVARDESDRLVIEVRDDGCGGATATSGSGLDGLADRVATCNGRLSVTSPPGGGTVVTIDVPFEAGAST